MRETTELLAYWITERELVRVRRERGENIFKYGYHDDYCMGAVRYCNVRREDDKVTKWLAQHWRPQHHSAWELVLARMVNYIPTLHQILIGWGQHPGEDKILRAGLDMKIERDAGNKIWTSAYTISTAGNSMDKVDYVMGVVAAVREQFRPPIISHLEDWHKALTRIKGVGSFLGAQVIADMKNTLGHPLQGCPDWYTWSAPGPGSLKGLQAYFNKMVGPATYDQHIRLCWEEVRPLLPVYLHHMHMQDFQNCLCEFSKYMRVRKGGHVRNKYPSGKA